MTPVICRARPSLRARSPRPPGSLTPPPAGAERAGSEQPERGGNQRGGRTQKEGHRGAGDAASAPAQLPARPRPPRQKEKKKKTLAKLDARWFCKVSQPRGWRLRGSRLRASRSWRRSLASLPPSRSPARVPSLVLSSIKYVPHDRLGHLAGSSESTLDNQS